MPATTELFENTPLSPAAPLDLYVCSERKAWIASRYRDVLAALRSSDLSQARPARPADVPTERQNMRAEMLSAISSAQISKWQIQIKTLAAEILQSLSELRSVDLSGQFIQPWCIASALELMSIDAVHSDFLSDLVSCLSRADAVPDDSGLKFRAKEANRELDRFFQSSFRKSMFLGIAQTVPAFLASAWAALLQHPVQTRELQAQANWMPNAVEELLRYAGPVHTLFRHADRPTEICGTKIERGDRLILRVASANRDALQFPDPDRLDFTRAVAGHLALGSGSHSCAGASLVRVMTSTATKALFTQRSEIHLSGPVQWSCGTMLIWASSVPVFLGKAW